MPLFQQARKFILRHFANMRWYNIIMVFIAYCWLSWWMLAEAGEEALVAWPDFLYWLVVTSSTVGYGDLSPVTPAGKYLVSLFVIPIGLSIFAVVLGRAAAFVSQQWRKGVRGMKNLHLHNHLILIGWNGERTMQLLNMLLYERAESDTKPDILLCVRADIENPMPGQIEFVKVSSFNKDEDMDRACVASASVLVLDNPEDDMTMTTALYCSQRNPKAHMLAYFKDESLAGLLKAHCPNVECTPSVAVEMLAKSAFDPGSSALHYDLLSLGEGQAQYSLPVPEDVKPFKVSHLFTTLKRKYNATLIGCGRSGEPHVMLNPDLDAEVQPGDKLFYIARKRINRLEWQDFEVEHV